MDFNIKVINTKSLSGEHIFSMPTSKRKVAITCAISFFTVPSSFFLWY